MSSFQHNLKSAILVSWRCASLSIITASITKQGNSRNFSDKYFIQRNLSSHVNQRQFSVSDICKEWAQRFKENDITEADLSIKYIVEHALGMKKAYEFDLNQDKDVTEEQIEKINTLCECRLARCVPTEQMPVQYIIKEWDFRSLQLAMQPPVFIPRPETEQLVDLVLSRAPQKGTFLEVGCGSGAIALSILKERKKIQVVAIDQSKMACDLTLENARLNNLTSNLQVVHSKLQEDGSLSNVLPVSEFDVIVSNPPYVPAPMMMQLEPEIKVYEDLRALEAGKDGLRVVRSLLKLAQTHLKAGGPIFLEVDSSHPAFLEKYLSQHPEIGVTFVKSYKDYCDKDRFVELKKS